MPHHEHMKYDADNFIVNKILTSFSIDEEMPSYFHVIAVISMASTLQGHHFLAHTTTLTAMYCVAFDPSNMSPDPVTPKSQIELEQIHSCYTSLTPYTVSECVHSVSIVYDSQHEVLFVVDRKQLQV